MPHYRPMAHRARRIDEADLSLCGQTQSARELMDGGHRICKALMRGDLLIRTVRFESTPEPEERIPLVG